MRVRDIPHALERRYGRPARRRRPLLDCLVQTILSQNTSDTLRDRAFRSLHERFDSYEKMEGAAVEEVARAIHPAGLHEQKARTIKRALEFAAGHGFDLCFICEMEPAEAYALLRGIKGIGDKTAKVCLLFSCGMPFFPVDTHIYRVARRMGLAPQKASRERVSEVLQELFEPDCYYSLHVNLIELGRELCKPRNPRCGECPLMEICKFGD